MPECATLTEKTAMISTDHVMFVASGTAYPYSRHASRSLGTLANRSSKR